MRYFKKTLAVLAVAVGFGVFAGQATASDPRVQPQFIGGYTPKPFPYPNPGPFPPRPLPFPYPGPFPPRVDFDYVVVYKPSIFSPWRVYGKFETLNQARFAERRLEAFGLPARTERVRDFGGIGW
jgi:hypothetical protein